MPSSITSATERFPSDPLARADVSVKFTYVYRNCEIAIQFMPLPTANFCFDLLVVVLYPPFPRPHQLQLIQCECHLLPVLAHTML